MQLFIHLAIARLLRRNDIPYLQNKYSFTFLSYLGQMYSFEVEGSTSGNCYDC